MRRAALLLAVFSFLTGCGSEHERTVNAPVRKDAARPARYRAGEACPSRLRPGYQTCQSRIARSGEDDDCQAMSASMIAVGSTDGATITKEGRKALKQLREALKSHESHVQCASGVDVIGEDGWTPYAPLAQDTPTP
jgi:hypothetical protein